MPRGCLTLYRGPVRTPEQGQHRGVRSRATEIFLTLSFNRTHINVLIILLKGSRVLTGLRKLSFLIFSLMDQWIEALMGAVERLRVPRKQLPRKVSINPGGCSDLWGALYPKSGHWWEGEVFKHSQWSQVRASGWGPKASPDTEESGRNQHVFVGIT